jgi:hypothetical protein
LLHFEVETAPLNMLSLRELTFALIRNSCGASGGDGVPCGIFPYIYKGWNGLDLSLT